MSTVGRIALKNFLRSLQPILGRIIHDWLRTRILMISQKSLSMIRITFASIALLKSSSLLADYSWMGALTMKA